MTQVLLLVQEAGHFLILSIFSALTSSHGLIFFSISSGLEMPTRSTIFGLLPLATKNCRGAFFFKLNLVATLRLVEAMSSQHRSIPVWTPWLLQSGPEESERICGTFAFSEYSFTQYMSHGSPPKRMFFSCAVSLRSNRVTPSPRMKS